MPACKSYIRNVLGSFFFTLNLSMLPETNGQESWNPSSTMKKSFLSIQKMKRMGIFISISLKSILYNTFNSGFLLLGVWLHWTFFFAFGIEISEAHHWNTDKWPLALDTLHEVATDPALFLVENALVIHEFVVIWSILRSEEGTFGEWHRGRNDN